jgi:hypothetical protein
MSNGPFSGCYRDLVMKNDDWPAAVARRVAREVRRHRLMQQPRMSVQKLADATDKLGMPIPRSVLANLESGRRDTVSVAEILVLAAALSVAPIDLICPVGFDEQTELLPDREAGPLSARRWFTGMWKLDIHDGRAWTMRTPGAAEQGNAQLLEYHDLLIAQLRAKESEAAQAAADLARITGKRMSDARLNALIRLDEADRAAATVVAAGDATAAELEAGGIETGAAKAAEVQARMQNVAEWQEFIREPLRRTREEMRRRGMLLPELPADIDLGEEN